MPRPAVVPEVPDGVDAPHERDCQLPKRREHEVVGSERERGTDLRGLLAFEPRIDGELTLPLERDALAVESPRDDHPSEQRAQVVGSEADVGIADR